MRHAEIEELLGAYALDAVEPEEARLVEEHLATCPRCRAEVATHRQVASLLGDSGGAAPETLWARIAGEIDAESAGPGGPVDGSGPKALASIVALGEVVASREGGPRDERRGGPTEPAASTPALRRRRPAGRRFALAGLGAVAAALALVVGLLASQVGSLNDRVAVVQSALSSGSLAEQALAASLDPRSERVDLASPGAGRAPTASLVLDRASGTAFWIGTKLPALARDRTYQLWSLVGGKPVSVGVLGALPHYAELRVEPDMSTFMVSNEPEGGSQAPTTPVLLQGSAAAL